MEATLKCAGSAIVVGGGLVSRLREYVGHKRVIIITDSNVHRRHTTAIDQYEHIIIGVGESNKTLTTVGNIYRRLIEMNAGRDCFIVGFGGGLVTDIAGFAASTYMRGVGFGFVCSTLLGQVDAGVGGKNGVNVDGYKNMIGTITQPEFVLCDTDLLKTLPDREFRAGLGEVVKAGTIADSQLFALLESYSYDELRNDSELLKKIIMSAIRVKASIVERDERESGERRKLNLGHTFGHALESCTDAYLHGEAVSIGMAMAARMAVRAGILEDEDAGRITSLLSRHGLPVTTEIDRNRLLKAIRMDKKGEGDSIWFVLPTGIGSCEVRLLGFDEIASLL